jgi:diguanylate cyclase (GGDEF)-like protein
VTGSREPKAQSREPSSSVLADQLADTVESVGLHRASLAKLVEGTLSRLVISEPEAEALVHLPASMAELSRRIGLDAEARPGQLYLCRPSQNSSGAGVPAHASNSSGAGVPAHASNSGDAGVPACAAMTCQPIGTLPARRQWKGELLLVAARTRERTGRGKTDMGDGLWQAWMTFNPEEVAASAEKLGPALSNSGRGLRKASEWLTAKAKLIRESPQAFEWSRCWGELLIDITLESERQRQHSESRANWSQLIATVQEAVGWELNTGKLFEAIADVMKRTFGFDYIEIQLLEQRGREYEVSAVHHRNDTAYGGPLLTVILKPKAQSEVIRGRRPRLVGPEQAGDMLMNPQLIRYMGFESGLLVPLVNQRRPNGLLKLFSTQPNQYGDNDLAAMEAVGQILSRTIENVKSNALLRRMATIDGLTNLYNRRFFMEQLTREFKRALRYRSNLAVIMLDIDHFKQFNDTHGHLKGDYILRTLGTILKSCVREVDVIGRYGGEEFAVILPEANIEQGLIVAEKIRQAVETFPFKISRRKSGLTPVTVSLGVSTLTQDIANITDLVNRADTALYRAKNEGRNRCFIFK